MISYDLINEKLTYGDEKKEAKMSEGPRLSCCLTFDFDAISAWIGNSSRIT
jgi:hypothetical protein